MIDAKPLSRGEWDELMRSTLHGPLPNEMVCRIIATASRRLLDLTKLKEENEALQANCAYPYCPECKIEVHSCDEDGCCSLCGVDPIWPTADHVASVNGAISIYKEHQDSPGTDVGRLMYHRLRVVPSFEEDDR